MKLIGKNSKGEIIEFKHNFNWNKDLIEIISIPNNLTELDCSINKLTSLPELPNNLVNLYCEDNQLTTLPKLPNTLKYLSCDNNNIKQLPDLSELKKLIKVWCDMCCFEPYMLEMKDTEFELFC